MCVKSIITGYILKFMVLLAVDMVWGAVLTSIVSLSGFYIVKWIQ